MLNKPLCAFASLRLIIALTCIMSNMGLSFLAAELISFDELAAHDQREITIRGFLYKSRDERIVLAREPNLKTCCVGASHKAFNQLIVTGDLPADLPSKAVTLQGRLHHQTGGQGRSYALLNAMLLEEPGHDKTFWIVLIVLLMIGLGAFLLYSARIKRNITTRSHLTPSTSNRSSKSLLEQDVRESLSVPSEEKPASPISAINQERFRKAQFGLMSKFEELKVFENQQKFNSGALLHSFIQILGGIHLAAYEAADAMSKIGQSTYFDMKVENIPDGLRQLQEAVHALKKAHDESSEINLESIEDKKDFEAQLKKSLQQLQETMLEYKQAYDTVSGFAPAELLGYKKVGEIAMRTAMLALAEAGSLSNHEKNNLTDFLLYNYTRQGGITNRLRSKRNKPYSLSHYENSQKSILQLAGKLESKDSIVIFGVGNANDIPLLELVKQFSKVHLVDMDAYSMILNWINFPTQELRDKVHMHVLDISGGKAGELLEKAYEIIQTADEAGTAMEQIQLLCMEGGNSIDFNVPELYPELRSVYAVSSMLASQLLWPVDQQIQRHLTKKYGQQKQKLNLDNTKIIEAHLLNLHRWTEPGGRTYYSDNTLSEQMAPLEEMVEAAVGYHDPNELLAAVHSEKMTGKISLTDAVWINELKKNPAYFPQMSTQDKRKFFSLILVALEAEDALDFDPKMNFLLQVFENAGADYKKKYFKPMFDADRVDSIISKLYKIEDQANWVWWIHAPEGFDHYRVQAYSLSRSIAQ